MKVKEGTLVMDVAVTGNGTTTVSVFNSNTSLVLVVKTVAVLRMVFVSTAVMKL